MIDTPMILSAGRRTEVPPRRRWPGAVHRSKEEIEELPGLIDRYPMDVELDAVAPMVMKRNLGRLYDLLTPSPR